MSEEKLTKKEKRELAREEKQKKREQEELRGKSKKLVNWVLVAAVLGFVGYRFYVWVNTPVDNTVATEVTEVAEEEWVKGDPQAEHTLIEYGDFQCPSCAGHAPFVAGLVSEQENLKVVYRHFPLVNIHPNAMPAALASEAAGQQGKFWEMHDILYDRQSEWSGAGNPAETFSGYAEELELDMEKYQADFESEEVRTAVNNDILSGNRGGVDSTPTFILNGSRVVLTRNINDFVDKVRSVTN